MRTCDCAFRTLCQALQDPESDAWSKAWTCCARRIAQWVRHHSAVGETHEEVGYFVTLTFERLWSAALARRLERIAPGQLVNYVKRCVHSVIVDELRARSRAARALRAVDEAWHLRPPLNPGIDESLIRRARRDELWAAVAEQVRSAQERVLVADGLMGGLPPRVIAQMHPRLFRSPADVCRRARNLRSRLRRDRTIQSWRAEGAAAGE